VVTLLPSDRASSSERVLADAVQVGLGPGSAAIVALLVVIATFGCCHGIVLASSRLAYAMARDGVFFRWFGRVNPTFRTPTRSVAVITIASILYVFATGFRELLAFFSFSVWIFYGLTAVALLILRRRRVGEPAAWRAPGGPAAPAIVLLVGACMTAGLTAEDPWRSLLSLGFLLAGFPAYAIWRSLLRRRDRGSR
jgi:amino acid transporter